MDHFFVVVLGIEVVKAARGNRGRNENRNWKGISKK
jgi:hypothetical protein